MLLFKEWHMKAIQKGEKTQTRRVWKESYNKPKKGSIHQAKTCLICKEYYFAKLEILDVYQERLGDITPEDALKEGGYTVEEFKRIWIGINGEWNPDLMVWVVEFKSVPDLDLQPGDKVKMSPECAEYLTYGDKLWTVASRPFWIGYTEGVFLESFSGYFSTKFLEKVEDSA